MGFLWVGSLAVGSRRGVTFYRPGGEGLVGDMGIFLHWEEAF